MQAFDLTEENDVFLGTTQSPNPIPIPIPSTQRTPSSLTNSSSNLSRSRSWSNLRLTSGLMKIVGVVTVCGLATIILSCCLISVSRTVTQLQETVSGLKQSQNQSVDDQMNKNDELTAQLDNLEVFQKNQTLEFHKKLSDFVLDIFAKIIDYEAYQENLTLQIRNEFASDVTGCGTTWTPYKHEKCVKILDYLWTQDDAEEECVREILGVSPQANLKMIPLLTIDSIQEQQFLDRLIFIDSKILDNVWLGSQRQVKGNESIFLWKYGNENGTGNFSLPDVNFHFENWQSGSPSSTLENRCVHMVPNGTRVSGGWSHDVDGQWQDAPCLRRNVVVCQKPQVFSLVNLKSYFVEFKKETTRKIQALEKIAGAVPLGFIYIQYRNQSAPSDLWPNLTWEEVTNFYSGEFFRALGNDTSSFGQIQSENAPRVTRVSYKAGTTGSSSVNLPVNAESGNVNSGSSYNIGGGYQTSMSFLTSGGEVRPKNSAVKIWRRV